MSTKKVRVILGGIRADTPANDSLRRLDMTPGGGPAGPRPALPVQSPRRRAAAPTRRESWGSRDLSTMVAVRITTGTEGGTADTGGHLFDIKRRVLIGPSGRTLELKCLFSRPRELEIRLQHVPSPEALLRLLTRHLSPRCRVVPLYFED